MALKFNQNERGAWVAEFEVTQDFNLHVERSESGYFFVNQRTTPEGLYDSIKGALFNYGDPVVDFDFTGVIYPKYIQVVSKVEPTYAEVTLADGSKVESTKTFELHIGEEYLWRYVSPNVTSETMTFKYVEGMTWGEWCDSKYNTINIFPFNDGDYVGNQPTAAAAWVSTSNFEQVRANDTITSATYEMQYAG